MPSRESKLRAANRSGEMSGNKVFESLVDELGKFGMDKAGDALEALAEKADSPWKKTVLALVEDAVEKYGPVGIEKAKDALDRIAKGKNADMSFASLRVRSDVLAQLQNAEADRKNEAKEFMAMVAKTLGQIIAAVIKGIIAAA